MSKVSGDRPYPWTCPTCGAAKVFPTTIPYDVEVKHVGELHQVHVPELKIQACQVCGELVFSSHQDDQIMEALYKKLELGAYPGMVHNNAKPDSLPS